MTTALSMLHRVSTWFTCRTSRCVARSLPFLAVLMLSPIVVLHASPIHRIVWNAVGQKEMLKVGENVEFVYKNANPENTRVVIAPAAAANEYSLELIRYNIIDRAIQNKNASDIGNDSLVRILKRENAELTLKVKNNRIYVEYDSLMRGSLKKSAVRSNELAQLNNKVPPPTASEKLSVITANLNQIGREIDTNKSEMKMNNDLIDSLHARLLSLGTSDRDMLLLRLYNFQIDSLRGRNDYLLQLNSLLAKDKDLLAKEQNIQQLELERQKLIRNAFILLSLIAIVFAIIYYFNYKKIRRYAALLAEQKEIIAAEQKKSDDLLLNILPPTIAERMKLGSTRIVDRYEEAGVIFIDIAQFTAISQHSNPELIVSELNKIYTILDGLCSRYGLEKIKTIGDCYMAAAGLPTPIDQPAIALGSFAIEAMNALRNYTILGNVTLGFRCGMDCGPVVAGVIGERKYIYDLWGDTVNTASRMEEYGEPGRIHITERLQEKLKARKAANGKVFSISDRGELDIKGKGKMHTYFLDVN